MALHFRSAIRKSFLLTDKRAVIGAIYAQTAAQSNLSPLRKPKSAPVINKYENNIVTSHHADCELHGMNLVHRFFQNASRWPNKIALVRIH